jgi:hypothetical protein
MLKCHEEANRISPLESGLSGRIFPAGPGDDPVPPLLMLTYAHPEPGRKLLTYPSRRET